MKEPSIWKLAFEVGGILISNKLLIMTFHEEPGTLEAIAQICAVIALNIILITLLDKAFAKIARRIERWQSNRNTTTEKPSG